MLIAEKPALRAIALAKHDVSDRLETRAAPCVEEGIDLCPSVEHDRYPVLLEYTIRFCHRWFEPGVIGIVLNRAPCAVPIVHQVRWIGEDEIDAVVRHLSHDFDAVAMKDLVSEVALLCGCCGRGCHL